MRRKRSLDWANGSGLRPARW